MVAETMAAVATNGNPSHTVKSAPPQVGPIILPRPDIPCEAPITAPTLSDPASFEIRLVMVGVFRLFPKAINPKKRARVKVEVAKGIAPSPITIKIGRASSRERVENKGARLPYKSKIVKRTTVN